MQPVWCHLPLVPQLDYKSQHAVLSLEQHGRGRGCWDAALPAVHQGVGEEGRERLGGWVVLGSLCTMVPCSLFPPSPPI